MHIVFAWCMLASGCLLYLMAKHKTAGLAGQAAIGHFCLCHVLIWPTPRRYFVRAEVAALGLHPPHMNGIHYASDKDVPADCPTVRPMPSNCVFPMRGLCKDALHCILVHCHACVKMWPAPGAVECVYT